MQENKTSSKISVIRRLPIVEITTGRNMGTIGEVVVNPVLQDIYLIVDNGNLWTREVLNSRDISGIGRDYVLIRNGDVITEVGKNPDLTEELKSYFPVLGLPVISTHGNALGTVVDFELHERHGELFNIELENGYCFSGSQIVSVCRKFIFIDADEDAESGSTSADLKADTVRKTSSGPEGLKLTREIHSTDGTFSIPAGTVLTDDIIREADKHGMLADAAMYAE